MTAINRRQKLESMLAASPHDQMLRYMLAMELDKESDHERSLELFRSLMSDTTPYVPAFLMAGQLFARLERGRSPCNVSDGYYRSTEAEE